MNVKQFKEWLEQFDDDTLHASDIYDLKEKLDWLKTVGCYVPTSAFEMIAEEIDND